MTEPLRTERVIDAPPDVVFDTFLTDDGQAAFYRQWDPGWVLDSDCDLRIGGATPSSARTPPLARRTGALTFATTRRAIAQ